MILLAVMFLFSLQVFSQEMLVRGTVTDDENVSLPGVTVVEVNTDRGTITDVNGSFQLRVSHPNAVLRFSFIGYLTKEVAVEGQNQIDVLLQKDIFQLSEIVVVGFGVERKDHVTGAASFVKMDQIIGDRPVVDAAQTLQGISPGLQVISSSGRPGDTQTSINIRGFPSITGGQPLVLVDNVPMALGDINPRDIESVSVLKDASASSIYGARAAFGVILITTKKGERDKPVMFDYSTTNSISSPYELPQKATTKDFVESLNSWGVPRYFANQEIGMWLDLINQYEQNPNQLDLIRDPLTGKAYPITKDPATGIHYPLADSDLFSDFLDDMGYSTIHNLSASGGSDKMAFRISAGYSYEDGVMVTDKDSYERLNLNANLNVDLTKRLTSRSNIYYRYSDRSNPIAQFNVALNQNRMYDPVGHFELPNGDILPFDTPGNTVRYRAAGQTNVQTLRIFQQFEYEFTKDLKLFGEFTTQTGSTKTMSFDNQPRFANRFLFEEESSDQARTQYNRGFNDHIHNSVNVYGDFRRSFGGHNLNLMTGYNWERRESEGFNINRRNMISNDVPGINTAIGDYGGGDSHGAWSVIGYFGRFNYNYRNRYLLESNLRYDGSSRFAQGSQFGLFPSVSAGWNISNEPFMEPVTIISSLRLRSSWGEVGNQNVADLYPTYPGYTTPEVRWINLTSDLRFVGILPANLVSPLLTWERVRTANLGLDFALFNNRFNTSFDVYRRETIDMLAPGSELPAMLGTPAPFANVADLETTGWELAMSWRDVKGDFNYRVNFSLYDSETFITKFDNPAGLLSQYYVGRKIGEIWGYVTDGFYTVDDFVQGTIDAHLSGPNRQLNPGVVQIEGAATPYPGDVKYADLNDDGMINHGNNTLSNPGDRTIIGNNSPRYQFGLNGNIGYKNWDFGFVLTGVGKRDLNLDGHVIWPWPSQFGNLYAHQLDFWTPDNQNAFYPRVHGNPFDNSGSNYGNSRRTQTKYLSDGRYLRINNITLGYSFPSGMMSKVGVNKLRVHVSANNVKTFHNLPEGLDPDQSDNGAYPFMRQISAGINLVF